jgi:hypothetical protein
LSDAGLRCVSTIDVDGDEVSHWKR